MPAVRMLRKEMRDEGYEIRIHVSGRPPFESLEGWGSRQSGWLVRRRSIGWASCGLSRRCTCGKDAADWWSVTETTMRPGEVVMLEPGEQGLVAFLRVGPMASVGPLA